MTQSIRFRLICTNVIPLLALTAAFILFSVFTSGLLVNDAMKNTIASAEQTVHAINQQNTASALQFNRVVSRTEMIGQMMAQRSREGLLALSAKVVEEMRCDAMTFTDAKGVALANVHRPDVFGEELSDVLPIAEALGGKSTAAVLPVDGVGFCTVVASPVYGADGALLGTVSTAYRLDTDAYVDNLKNMTKTEVTIFAGDTRVATTLMLDGKRAVGTKLEKDTAERVIDRKESAFGKAKVLGSSFYTSYSPIVNDDGTVAGIVFVGIPETDTTWIGLGWAGLVAFFLVVLYLILRKLLRSISFSLRDVAAAAKTLSSGDISVTIRKTRNDEIGVLQESFSEMVSGVRQQALALERIAEGDLQFEFTPRTPQDVIGNSIRKLLEQNNEALLSIAGTAAQVAGASAQIAQGSQSLAQGATEQSSTIDQLGRSIGQVDSKTRENVELTAKAARLGGAIRESAERGSAQMSHMMQAVQEINDASHSIGKVIGVIDNIAFQTNILALNAAVEAARAGQHGKGFAVVAEEVRSLAAKSADAARDTSGLIANSIAKAELGARIAAETADSLKEIVTGINESSVIMSEIARSSGEQASEVAQINRGIDQVAIVVQQNSATAEQFASSSEAMSGQSASLQRQVSRFKLLDDRQRGLSAPPVCRELPQYREDGGFGKY